MDRTFDVVVVGAGLSGLACARACAAAGLQTCVLEASQRIGGRAGGELVDGFQLDRGFQVLSTSYPHAQRLLDLESLDLRAFAAGALVRFDGRFRRIAHPLRRPLEAARSLTGPLVSPTDAARLALLVRRARAGSLDLAPTRPETSTATALEQAGLSPGVRGRVARPFLAGVMLDPELTTSSRVLGFVLRHLSHGDAALPAAGMQEIPRSLASGSRASLELGRAVTAVAAEAVELADGERVAARAVVVATAEGEATRLLGGRRRSAARHVTCLSFAADVAPLDEPILVLDGDGHGPVNDLCVPSAVSPQYAPAGAALVSATVLDDRGLPADALAAAVRDQLAGWFGPAAGRWQLLRSLRLEDALPGRLPGRPSPFARVPRTAGGIWVCGDHTTTASIDGALGSGARTAAEIIAAVRP